MALNIIFAVLVFIIGLMIGSGFKNKRVKGNLIITLNEEATSVETMKLDFNDDDVIYAQEVTFKIIKE